MMSTKPAAVLVGMAVLVLVLHRGPATTAEASVVQNILPSLYRCTIGTDGQPTGVLIGSAVVGGYENEFGKHIALSKNGQVMAAYSSHGSDLKNVKIFQMDSETNDWVETGCIEALVQTYSSSSGKYGMAALSLSADGTTLAFGERKFKTEDGNGSPHNAGAVRVFEYDTGSNSWGQKGTTMTGELPDGNSGYPGTEFLGSTVALAEDGNSLIVGGTARMPLYDIGDYSRVFEYNVGTSDWDMTKEFDGEGADTTGDRTGYHPSANFGGGEGCGVAMSQDGSIVASGAYLEGVGVTGKVHIRKKNADGNWEEVVVINGTNSGDRMGCAISLSADGSRLAVGVVQDAALMDSWTPKCVGVDGQLESKCYGLVRVYDIDVEQGTATLNWVVDRSNEESDNFRFHNDEWGASLSLSSDGKVLAVSAGMHRAVEIYREIHPDYETDGWERVWILQYDNSIHGTGGSSVARGQRFGWEVALSADGNVVAMSSPYSKLDSGDMRNGMVFMYYVCDTRARSYTYSNATAIADGSCLAAVPVSTTPGGDAGGDPVVPTNNASSTTDSETETWLDRFEAVDGLRITVTLVVIGLLVTLCCIIACACSKPCCNKEKRKISAEVQEEEEEEEEQEDTL